MLSPHLVHASFREILNFESRVEPCIRAAASAALGLLTGRFRAAFDRLEELVLVSEHVGQEFFRVFNGGLFEKFDVLDKNVLEIPAERYQKLSRQEQSRVEPDVFCYDLAGAPKRVYFWRRSPDPF